MLVGVMSLRESDNTNQRGLFVVVLLLFHWLRVVFPLLILWQQLDNNNNGDNNDNKNKNTQLAEWM